MSKRLGIKVPKKAISFSGLIWPYWSRLVLGAFLLFCSNGIIVLLPTLINVGVSIFESEQSQNVNFFGYSLEITKISSIAFLITFLAIFGALIRILSRVVIFGVGRSIER